jgi:dTDP-4-dehydrorhamnose reductase
MKILILGGNGMLGHKVYHRLNKYFETFISFRNNPDPGTHNTFFPMLNGEHIISVDALKIEHLGNSLKQIKPDAVINCIGIIKQRNEAKEAIPSIKVNALFPHQLSGICGNIDARLIHMSTDCVFSGIKGNYSEKDIPDPIDIYGRTKLLGELNTPGCLTLRTSIIGWELKPGASLLEWFALQRGKTIKGFKHAIYTGVATSVMADLIGCILEKTPDLSGIYNVASRPISKYDLLMGLRDALNWYDITIEPEEDYYCDRSLDGSLFNRNTGWLAPDWNTMIDSLAKEWPLYKQGRKPIP